MPTVLHRWQRQLEDSNVLLAIPAAKPTVSTMKLPADQEVGIAELGWALAGRGWEGDPA